MADASLIKYKLGKLGYTFFEVGEKIIVDSLIIEILKSNERRYIKAIPFIIYQSYTDKDKKPYLDLNRLFWGGKENKIEKEVNAILYVTREIFKATGKREDMIDEISNYLRKNSSEKEIGIFEILFKNKAGPAPIEFENYARNNRINWIDLGELASDFLMHKSLAETKERKSMRERLDTSHERNMLIHLSTLFSPKQREIIKKIIDEEPLTKTEYEYYIRVIKKRLEAIADLKDLAETAAKKKPKRARTESK